MDCFQRNCAGNVSRVANVTRIESVVKQFAGQFASASGGSAAALANKEKQLKDAEAAFDASGCKGFKKQDTANTAAEKAACAPLKAKVDAAQKARDECAAGSCARGPTSTATVGGNRGNVNGSANAPTTGTPVTAPASPTAAVLTLTVDQAKAARDAANQASQFCCCFHFCFHFPAVHVAVASGVGYK